MMVSNFSNVVCVGDRCPRKLELMGHCWWCCSKWVLLSIVCWVACVLCVCVFVVAALTMKVEEFSDIRRSSVSLSAIVLINTIKVYTRMSWLLSKTYNIRNEISSCVCFFNRKAHYSYILRLQCTRDCLTCFFPFITIFSTIKWHNLTQEQEQQQFRPFKDLSIYHRTCVESIYLWDIIYRSAERKT